MNACAGGDSEQHDRPWPRSASDKDTRFHATCWRIFGYYKHPHTQKSSIPTSTLLLDKAILRCFTLLLQYDDFLKGNRYVIHYDYPPAMSASTKLVPGSSVCIPSLKLNRKHTHSCYHISFCWVESANLFLIRLSYSCSQVSCWIFFFFFIFCINV